MPTIYVHMTAPGSGRYYLCSNNKTMKLLSCPFPCHLEKTHSSESSQSHQSSIYHLHSESTSSLSSQPSLPSVHSLTPQPSQQFHHDSNTQLVPTAGHRCIATLKGHSSFISSVALAGKFLVSGSSDGEVRSWSRHPLRSPSEGFSGHAAVTTKSAVKCVVVLGDKIVTAHHDRKIRVWRVEMEPDSSNGFSRQNFKFVASLPTLNDRVEKLFSPSSYVEVRRHKKCTWVHHVDAVSALSVSKDDLYLYSASWDRTLKVWRTTDFRCMESVSRAHEDAINAVVCSADGLVYTGSADKTIKVWKKDAGGSGGRRRTKHELLATLEKHKSAVNALALSPDGKVMYSGACDRSILVWEKDEEGEGGGGGMVVVGALRGHTKAILCLAVVGDLVFSGSADRTVRIWRRGMGGKYSCLGVCEGHSRPVKSLTARVNNVGGGDGGGGEDGGDDNKSSSSSSGSSYLVYSGGLDCDIKVWQVWVPSSCSY